MIFLSKISWVCSWEAIIFWDFECIFNFCVRLRFAHCTSHIAALVRFMNILFREVVLYHYEPIIQLCMKCCCDLWSTNCHWAIQDELKEVPLYNFQSCIICFNWTLGWSLKCSQSLSVSLALVFNWFFFLIFVISDIRNACTIFESSF